MTNGYLHLFRWRGVPVRMHWSVSLLVVFAFGARGNAFASLLGLGTIVLVHELGHAVLVHRFDLEVLEIRIYPFGGECIHEATDVMREQVIIAWGGVLAQLVLLIGAAGLLSLPLPWSAMHVIDLLDVLIGTNVLIVAFNLLPIRPLDGHKAWRLKYLLPSTRRIGSKRSLAPRRDASTKQKQDLEALVDAALDEARDHASAEKRRTGKKPV